MNKSDAYFAICSWLRPLVATGAPVPVAPDTDWKLVAAVSSSHFVTPALALTLCNSTEVPEDFRIFLSAMLDAMTERNALLSDEVALVLQHFNAADVTPVLLKGVGGLVSALYPHVGFRVMGDLDLLFRKEELPVAVRILDQLEFKGARPKPFSTNHHFPIRIHEQWPAGIELHTEVLPAAAQHLVEAAACIRSSSSITFRGCQAMLPSATDRAAHNIAHSQIVDGAFWRGVPQIRQLLDLALLRKHYEQSIDWNDIADRFRSCSQLPVLTDVLGLSHVLFGQPPPAGLGVSTEASTDRLVESLERRKGFAPGELSYILRSAVAHQIANPGGHSLSRDAWDRRWRRLRRRFAR